jgi:hypothetical protein
MPVIDLPLVQIKEFETQVLFEQGYLSAGTYHVQLQIEGNSILSSLLVTDCPPDSSITVNYFQTTSGDENTERSPLTSHSTIYESATAADTIIVARVHLKPVCEVKIIGGPIKFGLMVTMVSAFATDIEASLFKDGTVVKGGERGIPVLSLDTTAGTLNYLRSRYGKLIVDNDDGDAVHLSHTQTLPRNVETVVLSKLNLDKSFKVSQFSVVTASDYKFGLYVDGLKIASFRTSASMQNLDYKFSPYKIASKGSLVTVKALRTTALDDGIFELYLRGYDFTNPEESPMTNFSKIAFNNSGSLILPLKAVAWKDDNSIALADADGIGIDDFAGITQSGISNQGYGLIYKLGEVPNALVGKGAIAGQSVFLSAIPGELTLVAPLTGTVLRIGRAEPPSGGGTGEATSLFIDPQIVSE